MFFIITLHHHQHGESCIRGQGLNNFLRASILRRTSARSISQAITLVIHTICMMELWTCYHVHICCLQRPKKSELSGWQNSICKNFPDEVRKSFLQQKKCVNCFSQQIKCVNCFLQRINHFRDKKVHKIAI